MWEAWWTLSADRPIGFGGAGPIPFQAIDRYADRFGISDPDEFNSFVALIAAMDDVLFAAQRKKQKPEPKTGDR